jgi:hypothetical protein
VDESAKVLVVQPHHGANSARKVLRIGWHREMITNSSCPRRRCAIRRAHNFKDDPIGREVAIAEKRLGCGRKTGLPETTPPDAASGCDISRRRIKSPLIRSGRAIRGSTLEAQRASAD